MAVVQLKTRVLPGKRIEVENAELVEGEEVQVTITPAVTGQPPDETPEEWSRRFLEWANSHKDFPELAPEAFEREHFYGDRG